MSSSRRSGSVSWNSSRHSGLLRETCCAAGPVCQTLRSQTQSNPIRGQAVEFGVGDVVQRGGPAQAARDSSVSQTRVLIWYSEG